MNRQKERERERERERGRDRNDLRNLESSVDGEQTKSK